MSFVDDLVVITVSLLFVKWADKTRRLNLTWPRMLGIAVTTFVIHVVFQAYVWPVVWR